MVQTGSHQIDAPFREDLLSPEAALSQWAASRAAENEVRIATLQLAASLGRGQSASVVAVVDDETVVAVTLTEILRRSGLLAVWFTEGAAALRFLTDNPVDLLIADIDMPDVNGVSLCAEAHRSAPQCVLILFSARASDPALLQSVSDAAIPAHLYSKPLCPRKLTRGIAGLLAPVR